MTHAFLTSTGSFLPGPPVDNSKVEEILGLVDRKPSRLRARILKANGIQTRHYAIDCEQRTTHSAADMGVAAAMHCVDESPVPMKSIGMLSCATTQGDMVVPGFGSMVQAGLGIPGVELLTTHGICSSSVMAIKAAANSLSLGQHASALVVVSELASRLLKHTRYEAAGGFEAMDFNSEFLRWMLSDGAGAWLIENAPRGRCLRMDWIHSFSHADAFPVCMGIGLPTDPNDVRTWQDFPTYREAEAAGALLIRQDVRLLEQMVKLGVDGALRLIEAGTLVIRDVDHFLCHYSSHHFRGKIAELLDMCGASIPEDRWFTNLYTRGNTGAASILIMMDEFLRGDRARVGDTVLCMVPESGRFNTAYMHFTLVES